MKEQKIAHFLKNSANYQLSSYAHMESSALVPLSLRDLELFHIQEITYEEDAPQKEAFENVISSMKIEGANFIYLVIGNKNGVRFYFGVAKNLNSRKELALDIDEVGKDILKSSIEGNFRGSKVERVKDKAEIQSLLKDMKYCARIDGVPGINEDNEDLQGMDRLVDVLAQDEFVISLIASPIDLNQILTIEETIYQLYDALSPFAKKNIQTSTGTNITVGTSEGTNYSETEGKNQGTNSGTNEGQNSSKSISTNKSSSNNGSSSSTTTGGGESTQTGTSSGTSQGESKGTSFSKTVGNNKGTNSSKTDNESTATSLEYSNKSTSEWLKYIDDILLPKLDYAKSRGLFNTNMFILSKNKLVLTKLGNTISALFTGSGSNKVPLNYHFVQDKKQIEAVQNFQLVNVKLKTVNPELIQGKTVLSQNISSNNFELGHLMSSNELSLIAGLPQKEVVGLALKEEVEFGLNPQVIKAENNIPFGKLVKSGIELNYEVALDREALDKHIFIAGVTGSGKTTTCQKILHASNMPFLVIEPAKTEYRILKNKYDDLLIFTLGTEKVAPFRLNPFEFFPHENISSRVDMIKASLESAFDMEAAIPQLIEAAIYRCYQDKGWNVATGKNIKFDDPFADGVFAFPTLSDLLEKVGQVATDQGFDERLKNDYIGSIKARLQGLTLGSKGLMLNTKRSINFKQLLEKKIILELEEIRNGSEKSLIMGFILANLNEALRSLHLEYQKEGKRFKHITLIEEAHRLLSKYEPGDSNNKKQGVEAFADMLAEVRKYGESLVIVDQIPNKLTPEVLKNTNTKIIHKIFAKDDKEAVGNTMALDDDQKQFLSSLQTGRVIFSSLGYDKAIQVQVKPLDGASTTTDSIDESAIRKQALGFYLENYKSGVIEGLESLENLTIEGLSDYLDFKNGVLDELVENFKKAFFSGNKIKRSYQFKPYIEKYGHADLISEKIYEAHYVDLKESEEAKQERMTAIKAFLETDDYLSYKDILFININNK